MSETIEVLITLPFTDEMVSRLEKISPRLKIKIIRTFRLEDIPQETWAGVEVLYTDRLLPSPEQAPNLRWIQFHWAGINHALGTPILKTPDIKVTTLSGVAATKVAEFGLMMILALGLRLPEILLWQRKSEWPADRWERFKPRELRDSTVGIVGYGSIGRQLARLLQPFGGKVLATKRDVMQPQDVGYIVEGFGDPGGDFVWRLYPGEALQTMVKLCDFVVVTMPLTVKTHHLINADIFSAMKTSAYLIDVSRGGIVEQNALIDAIKEHKIAGAAIDVFSKEPLPADNPLWKLPNVILSPHIAGVTHQYDERAVELFEINLRRYLGDEPLLNDFKLELEY